MNAARESPMSAVAASAVRSAVETSLKAFDSLGHEEREDLKAMLCEFFDTEEDEARMEVAISILEHVSPPTYFDVGRSLDLGEWLDSDDGTRLARRRLADRKHQFADNVRRLMAERDGLTQSELSKRLGCTQPTVSAILKGEHKPQPRTLKKLADALGVEITDLWPA